MIPTTLSEAIQALRDEIGSDGQVDLMNLNRDELFEKHYDLGRWIRNTWMLWKGGPLMDHMKSLGLHHPDDISSLIIKECWLKLNGQPSELERDVAEYKSYWDKITRSVYQKKDMP